MFKRILLIILFGLAGLLVMAQEPGESKTLVIKNVHIIDGIDNKILKNGSIVIKGETISDIYLAEKKEIPGDAFILDMADHYVIPGLIDAHVHISHDVREEIEAILSLALKGGVTSVRDMGGDARILAGLKRDALIHKIESPYIYYSATMAGPGFFKDPRVIYATLGETPGQVPWAQAIDADTDMEQVIAEAKGCGAVGIKIYANLPKEEIQRIAAESHRQGLKTWSHAAVFPAKPGEAVLAGVDVTSHTALLAWENADQVPQTYDRRYDTTYDVKSLQTRVYQNLFKEMVKRDTILDATVFIFYQKTLGSAGAKEHAEELAKYSVEATKAAHQQGVKIAVGTDFMYDPWKPFPNIHDEIGLLVSQCGFTPMEAIQSATRINAEALGIEKQTGTIEKGKRADMVILAADPSEDIRNLGKIRCVIKGGKIYIRQE